MYVWWIDGPTSWTKWGFKGNWERNLYSISLHYAAVLRRGRRRPSVWILMALMFVYGRWAVLGDFTLNPQFLNAQLALLFPTYLCPPPDLFLTFFFLPTHLAELEINVQQWEGKFHVKLDLINLCSTRNNHYTVRISIKVVIYLNKGAKCALFWAWLL